MPACPGLPRCADQLVCPTEPIRFWDGDQIAIDTLHTVLSVFTRVTAPLLPFISEAIYDGLHGDEPSVHLGNWPAVDELPADDDLVASMDLARDVCSSTLSVRKAHQRRVRLPLQSLTIAAPDAGRLVDLVDLIANEVNVRAVDLTTDVGSVASEELKLVPARLGPRLGKDVQSVIKAHKAGDWSVDGDLVTVGGFVLEAGEYSIEQVASDDQASTGLAQHVGVVALDTTVTEELEIEGRARDLIRSIQQARRDADLDVSDRIELDVNAGPAVAKALRAHQELVMAETLATAVRIDETGDDGVDAMITVVSTR